MRVGRYRITVDWGHLLLLAFMAGWIVWYNIDIRRASTFIENTILIAPTSLLALALCAVVAVQTVRLHMDEVGTTTDGVDLAVLARPAGLMASLGLYVLLLEWIGFDLASMLFVAAGMIVTGERRWYVVLPFAVLFGSAVVFGLKAILPLQIPTALF